MKNQIILYFCGVNPKVIIVAPTNQVKEYCQFRWIEQVLNLNYSNYSIYLSDNTLSDDFANKIMSYNIKVGRVNPTNKSNSQYIADSHEQCRNYAIEQGADYILHWEVDLFTDNKFIIQDLLFHNRLVVGCLYHIGQGEKSYLCVTHKNKRDNESSISVYINKSFSDILFVDGNLKDVFSCGLGCTLIHKSVFEKVKFRSDFKQTYHPDSCFAEDCYYLKIPINVDTSILLKHENSRWLMY